MNKTIKTSELSGIALDWAVAVAGGYTNVEDPTAVRYVTNWKGTGKQGLVIGSEEVPYSPSREWSRGGPIIDANDIAISPLPDGLWCAYAPEGTRWISCLEEFVWKFKQQGYHPLIAAMRCFCFMKLGKTVDVPEEFLV